MDRIEELFRRIIAGPGVEPSPPATEADFAHAEASMGFEIPEDLRAIYSIANGVTLTPDFRLNSLADAAQYGGYGTIHSTLRLVPLSDENDSNPYCLICASPLMGKVLHLNHDGVNKLCFDNLESFLETISNYGTQEFYSREGLKRDITQSCLKTFKWVENLPSDDDSRMLLLSLAFDGLKEGYEEKIQEFLSDKDEYVREAALKRLKEIGTPAAKKAVYDDSISYERFVADVAAVLASVGIQVREHRQLNFPVTLIIEPGRIGLNMQSFYAQRNDPLIFQRVIERAQHFIRQKR